MPCQRPESMVWNNGLKYAVFGLKKCAIGRFSTSSNRATASVIGNGERQSVRHSARRNGANVSRTAAVHSLGRPSGTRPAATGRASTSDADGRPG